MTEQQAEEIVVVKVTGEDNQFYWKRLVNSIQLRHDIDTGVYPLKNWSGTDEQNNPWPNGELPIWSGRGLRQMVLHAIESSYSWLKNHGNEREAQLIIDADRDRSKREGLL